MYTKDFECIAHKVSVAMTEEIMSDVRDETSEHSHTEAFCDEVNLRSVQALTNGRLDEYLARIKVEILRQNADFEEDKKKYLDGIHNAI